MNVVKVLKADHMRTDSHHIPCDWEGDYFTVTATGCLIVLGRAAYAAGEWTEVKVS